MTQMDRTNKRERLATVSSRAAVAHIGALVQAKRREAGLGLRAASGQSGISASTLSRLERGVAASLPDAETLSRLSAWLQVPVGSLMATDLPATSGAPPDLTTPEVVEVHLRADKHLSPSTADALAKMFKMLYDQFSEIELRGPIDPAPGDTSSGEQALR
jgi:transcriptional regulator with XRE-family HTH domain